ncbi:terminase GpA, partial [Escherichia coli EC1856]
SGRVCLCWVQIENIFH